MSTISTQLNWGSSYIVNDFYSRFVNKSASEKQKVLVGRISTIVLMVMAALFSFYLQSAKDVFNLLITDRCWNWSPIYFRWFWHRINPYSEIAAMVISFVIAVFFFVNGKLEEPLILLKPHWQLTFGVIVTTIGWIVVTYITKPSTKNTIEAFDKLVFANESKFKGFGMKIVAFVLGTLGVYATLFSIGSFIYGNSLNGFLLLATAIIFCVIIFKLLKKTN